MTRLLTCFDFEDLPKRYANATPLRLVYTPDRVNLFTRTTPDLRINVALFWLMAARDNDRKITELECY